MNSNNFVYKPYNKINERHRSWSDATDILDEELVSKKTTRLLDCIMILLICIVLVTVYSQLIMQPPK